MEVLLLDDAGVVVTVVGERLTDGDKGTIAFSFVRDGDEGALNVVCYAYSPSRWRGGIRSSVPFLSCD